MAFHTVIFGESVFPFLSDPSFFMQEIPGYKPGEKNLLILTKELIQKYNTPSSSIPGYDSWKLTEVFLHSLYSDYSETHPCNKNIFVAIYKENKLANFGRPVICRVGQQNQLIFGAMGNDLHSNKFPLVYKDNGVFVESNQLGINYIEIPDMASPDPTNNKLKIPVVNYKIKRENNTNLIYQLALRVDKDTTDYYTIEESWNFPDSLERESQLNSLIKPLYAYSSPISAMFSQQFMTKTFPKDGIVLKVINAIHHPAKGEGYPWISLDIDTSQYVDRNGNPFFTVLCRDQETRQMFPVGIDEVGSIMLSTTHVAGKKVTQYQSINPNGLPTPEKPWYLHITGPNQRNVNHVPEHALYDSGFIPTFLKPVIEASQNQMYYLGGIADSDHLDLLDTINTNPL